MAATNGENARNPRILCLHGYKTSAKILDKMVGRWPKSLLDEVELVFLDAPFPAQEGLSEVEAIFDPPYFEWFQANQDYTEYYNFEDCVEYVEDYMIKHGPFDGILGFSQGAMLAAALAGMQQQRVGLTRVPSFKSLILISGAKFGESKYAGIPNLASNAFSSPIKTPSLHIIGESDFLKEEGSALLQSFTYPVPIYHPNGHIVPKLDAKGLEVALRFIKRTKGIPSPRAKM